MPPGVQWLTEKVMPRFRLIRVVIGQNYSTQLSLQSLPISSHSRTERPFDAKQCIMADSGGPVDGSKPQQDALVRSILSSSTKLRISTLNTYGGKVRDDGNAILVNRTRVELCFNRLRFQFRRFDLARSHPL